MPAAASISDASSPKIHEKKEPLIDRWIQIRSLSLTRPPTLHSYRPAFDAASRPSVSDMPPKGLLALAYCQLISTFLAVRNPSSLAGAALNTGVELRLDKMIEAQVSSLGLRAVMREQIRAALPAQHVRQLLSKPSPARRVRKNHATMPILSAAAMASSSSAVLTEKSFMRLQQKITKCSDDETIFAWAFKTSVWIWSYRLQKPSMNRPRS
ncbi:hypothetical protein LTR49_024387 [Elasticomyces elasticus]|nr:hypothetical protein LTR49_024387 [Elasticomyces elasticus]